MVFIVNNRKGDIPQPQYCRKHCKYAFLILFANMNNIKSFLKNTNSDNDALMQIKFFRKY